MEKNLYGICLFSCCSLAMADVYFEGGFEEGGDKFSPASSDTRLSANGGYKFVFGYRHFFNESKNSSLSLALGKIFNSKDGEDDCGLIFCTDTGGETDYEANVLDAIFRYAISEPGALFGLQGGRHWLGAGVSYYFDATYEYEDLPAAGSGSVDFDNALGPVVEYSYGPADFQVGLRYTDLELESDADRVDASSLGLFANFSL